MADFNVKDISLKGSKAERINFCNAWAAAKEGLTLLAAIVRTRIVRGAITLIIKAGDAISRSICG
ncbi:MAG TPA: hypothetical protein PLD02_03740 [Saprospiraceae bacterium]|nr:hypothetical protein [Saprospiraceae bacterium]